MRFRRRPETSIIEAEKFDPANPLVPYPKGACPQPVCPGMPRAHVHSASGIMLLDPGDWIVRERTGEPLYYKIVPREFVKLYEPAED